MQHITERDALTSQSSFAPQDPSQTLLQRLQRVVRGTNDGFWEWHLPSGTVWYAPRFLELLGFEPGDFSGDMESWEQRIHPEDRPKMQDAFEYHLQTGETLDIEHRLQKKCGTYCWFRCRGMAYHDRNGEPEYLSGSLRYIDDLKRAEKMLLEKEWQLLQQQKMEAVGSLAGGVAHEFNNLLQAIRGFTTFAQEEMPQDSQPFCDLGQVLVATDQAAKLSRQLLDFSRCDQAEPADCLVDSFIQNLANMLTPLISETIQVHFDLNVPQTTVRADPAQMEQALLNLCLNARDAMPEGGELKVRSERIEITDLTAEAFIDIPPGCYVRISVSDTGSGIPQEVQQHIFDPFFTTKEVGCGTGLGLATTFGVVQRCHGHIAFHSEPERGSTFRIYLPISIGNAVKLGSDNDIKPIAVGLAGRGETILLAEDDCEVGRRMLLRAGYNVLTAANGVEALQLYDAHGSQIDLFLLDIIMPELTGREVLDRLHERGCLVPVCFCSGYDQSESLRELGHTMIEKPFHEQQFLATVRETLEDARALCARTE